MTEETRQEPDAAGASGEHRPTLGEMSHTNPYTGDVFGATQTYGRGRVVAADGGADPDREPDEEAGTDGETLKEIDHTPPGDSDGAAPVYERGNEGREDARDPEDAR
jgi:hypothetical protein